ncbi:diacylglycerol kinase [Nostoc sp. 3335mG]|nr:diacylglycerol kinase [Nostoc sp. 3335mG]
MDQPAARRFHIILNPNSGTVLANGITAAGLEQEFKAAGLDAVVDGAPDISMDEKVARAAASDADVVVAAGGDGTITALAGALAGTDKALGILPLGTVNALAKDLGLPLDLAGAVKALASAQPRQIDVGEVNGRVFLHKVVIGIVPSMAAAREHIRGDRSLRAKWSFLRFMFHRLTRARRMAVAIEPKDGVSHVVRAKAVAVACNAYDEGLGLVFKRGELAGGVLTIYTLTSLGVGDFVRLAGGMVLGNWTAAQALSMETSRAVTIRSRKKLLKVMFDGEVESLETPLDFVIRPLALTVLAPADPTATEEGSAA